MSERMNWFMKLVLIAMFGGFVFFVFLPMLQSFFDPQEFLTFLNPLGEGMPFGEYMINGWSWNNSEGDLIGFFRPLASATYMIEYPLFGINPLGYKLVSLGIHLLCAVFVARFVMLLSERKWLAVFAGALFAVHPGTVVAAGMISARPDIMASLFSILAVISTYSLSRISEATWKAFIPALFLLLALASKELGIVNILALPIMYFLWPGREKCKENTISFLGSLVIVEALYFVSRGMIFGNIGGYGGYTELTEVPMHLATMVAQATGIFFLELSIIRVVFYLSILYAAVNFARKDFRNWQKVLVALLLTGAFGFQSLIGDVATHYVYAPAAFTVLFLVYFTGAIKIPGRRGNQIQAGIAILILLFAGAVTRRESFAFNNIYVSCEKVYTSLEDISDSLPRENGSVCFVLLSSNSQIETEMKNIPLYMGSVDTGNQCEFIPVREEKEGEDAPILVWEEDRIVIR